MQPAPAQDVTPKEKGKSTCAKSDINKAALESCNPRPSCATFHNQTLVSCANRRERHRRHGCCIIHSSILFCTWGWQSLIGLRYHLPRPSSVVLQIHSRQLTSFHLIALHNCLVASDHLLHEGVSLYRSMRGRHAVGLSLFWFIKDIVQ